MFTGHVATCADCTGCRQNVVVVVGCSAENLTRHPGPRHAACGAGRSGAGVSSSPHQTSTALHCSPDILRIRNKGCLTACPRLVAGGHWCGLACDDEAGVQTVREHVAMVWRWRLLVSPSVTEADRKQSYCGPPTSCDLGFFAHSD